MTGTEHHQLAQIVILRHEPGHVLVHDPQLRRTSRDTGEDLEEEQQTLRVALR